MNDAITSFNAAMASSPDVQRLGLIYDFCFCLTILTMMTVCICLPIITVTLLKKNKTPGRSLPIVQDQLEAERMKVRAEIARLQTREPSADESKYGPR